MWWLLLGCVGAELADSATVDSGWRDTARPTGSVPLEDEPSWMSTEAGFATGAAWADLDGDGFAELVVSYGNDMEPGPLSVYDNVDGVLEQTASWRSDGSAYHGHLSVGDVDGDGWIDVAVSRFLGPDRFDSPGGLDVYRNLGGELEGRPSWSSPESFFTFSCALGDVDRDGDLDLAAAVGEPYFNEPDRSVLYRNSGDGSFTLAWETEAPRHSLDVGWADLDADGWLDLVFANLGSGHTAYLSDAGELGSTPSWTAPGPGVDFGGNTLDWGDLNGDGWLDLAISDNSQSGARGTVSVWCGPELQRCWESEDEADYQSAVSLVDVDANGELDVVAGAWWGAVRVYLSRDGALSPEPDWSSVSTSVVEAFAWEDVDGSHWTEEQVEGNGLIALPERARVLEVSGGVAGEGWVSGPGALEVRYLVPTARDLLVSNWERDAGNLLHGWTGP